MLLQTIAILLLPVLAAGSRGGVCATALAELEAIKATTGSFKGMCEPVCKEDGTYADVQCCGAGCFCSTSLGEQIMDYSVPRWEAQGMTCNCAKEHKDISDSGLLGRYVFCEKNGDYKPVRCVGAVCHCVDTKTGERVGSSSAPIGQDLNC